jgi:hypothetical protein
MDRLLYSGIIDGQTLHIRQEMIDSSTSSATWANEGPFVPGLKYATLDGRSLPLDELSAFLRTHGRADLIAEFKIP